MSLADVGRTPPAIAPVAVSTRIRALTALALAGLSILAATGVVANHTFHQPTTLKYVVTVLAPLLLSLTCISRDPLRVLVGAAIITAPWDLNVTFEGVRVSPVIALLSLAVFVALLTPPSGRSRATVTGSVLAVALALLLPALAIGNEQPHFITWILATLAAGWLAFQIVQQPGGLRFLLSLLVVAATVQSLVAFYEFARHANLDLYSSEINETVSQHYFFNFAKDFRPAGTLPDPDSLGNMLALACPLALTLALAAPSRLVRLAWAVCAVMITTALTLSFSRMSWIGAGAGVVLVLILLPGRRRLAASAGVAALLVVTVIVGLSLGGANLRERFDSIQDPTARVNRTAQGDEEREQIWSAALDIAAAHPIVGVGLGRLREHLSEHLGASQEVVHAQSVYFQFLSESGVVGLLALLLLVWHAATGVVVGIRRDRLLVAALGGAMVAILVGWSTDTTARYTGVSVMIAFVFGAAMAQHTRLASVGRRGSRRGGLRLATGAALER